MNRPKLPTGTTFRSNTAGCQSACRKLDRESSHRVIDAYNSARAGFIKLFDVLVNAFSRKARASMSEINSMAIRIFMTMFFLIKSALT